jgi:hypothetical protein
VNREPERPDDPPADDGIADDGMAPLVTNTGEDRDPADGDADAATG